MDDPESEAAQRVGTTLCNKWTLERLVGTGGMAAVYVANHKIGRREAIKILHSDVARDPELRARFEQEADAVNRFKHPGAVEVRDIDVAEDGSPFLVMELLDGHPLAQLARQPGGVELHALLRMMDELLDVLAAAHAQGIIHRDIKPDNLFVLQDGRLKVLDFGIARVRAGAPSKLRTRAGATLGTAPYMPPEQIRGAEIDARADLFAVGATMFRLIAKRRVHEAGSETETLVKMASEQAPPLASAAPDAPRDVCLVVDRALMFDREQRFPDALTMQGDVRALREGRPPPYASARLLFEGGTAKTGSLPASTAQSPPAGAVSVVVTPPSSSGSLTRGPGAGFGTEQTAVAGAGAQAVQPASGRTAAASPGAQAVQPASGRTAAASPGALHTGQEPVSADPVTRAAQAPSPASPASEAFTRSVQASPDTPAPSSTRDPATRPAMMVLGAAGLGAPLAASSRGAAAVNPAAGQAPPAHDGAQAPAGAPPANAAAPATATPPSAVEMSLPQRSMGERTLRSVQGPEAAGAPVSPQGYSVAASAQPPAQRSGAMPGPRTQVAGMAPPAPLAPLSAPAPLAPGESIPVMPAPPPPPRRRRTLPGTEISVVPLVLVGVVFAALGVSITLWLMLRGPNQADMSTDPSVTSTSDPSDSDLGPRGASRPATHAPVPPRGPAPVIGPQSHPPQPKGGHGKQGPPGQGHHD